MVSEPKAKSILKHNTVWPADTIEFCPHPDAHNILVCGTYKLQEEQNALPSSEDDIERTSVKPAKQTRHGELILWSLDPSVDGEDETGEDFRIADSASQDESSGYETEDSHMPGVQHAKSYNFLTLQKVSMPAIPDVKWCHRERDVRPLLAAADTEGHVTLHEYLEDAEGRRLQQFQSIECAESDVLCLSLDWSNRRNPTSALGKLVVSMSNGNVALLNPENSSGLTVMDTWKAHDYEPWVAAFNYWDPNIIYTGGDDMALKGWDSRVGYTSPLFTGKRFNAGVTSIQSHPHLPYTLAVGSAPRSKTQPTYRSYDDTVYLFDTRITRSSLTQVDVGGGAWRVKWHPSAERKRDLLVAGMHGGCKVIQFHTMSFDREATTRVIGLDDITASFTDHESMAYGADWSYGSGSLIASCSFYDHAMHLWQG